MTPATLALLVILQGASAEPAEPRRLWLEALDRYDAFRAEDAIELLRAARARAPEYLPGHISYSLVMRWQGRGAELRDELTEEHSESAVAACMAAAHQIRETRLAALLAVERSSGRTGCTAYFLTEHGRREKPAERWLPVALDAGADAVRMLPELGHAWLEYAEALRGAGDAERAEDAVRAGLAATADPGDRVRLYRLLATLREEAGDAAGARDIRRALGAALVRGGPANFTLGQLYVLGQRFIHSPRVFGILRRGVEVASRVGAPEREWSARYRLAIALVDQGRPAEAMPHYRRLEELTDAVGQDTLRMKLLERRGRAHAMLGSLAEAEADLAEAITLAEGLQRRALLARALHDLAHVHEAAGRLEQAGRTIDRAIEVATGGADTASVLLIALRDAGMIQWKAGRPSAAHARFAEMVRVIELEGRAYSWAGEYHERIGDLPRAVAYYRRGLAADPTERGLNLAGLARAHEALGLPDSAAAFARAHDEALTAPGAVPLLPELLARRGRLSEGIEHARAWAERRARGGAVEGVVNARLQVAELELRAGNTRSAVQEARAARATAEGMGLVDARIRALRIEGEARLATGERPRALAALRTAAALAAAHPTVDGIVATHLALARALGRSGPAEALRALDRAAGEVERATGLMPLELDRVRYRAAHLEPFDAAVRLLVDAAEPDLEALVLWSQRRKAAALTVANRADPGPGAGAVPVRGSRLPLPEIRRRLGRQDAVLEYSVLGDVVAATVVTRGGAHVVRLATSPDELARLVARLRRPLETTYGGRLDLGRARFDAEAAAALHEALLDPLLTELAGRTRLFIVPDAFLHGVPFDALVAGSGAASRDGPLHFLVDRFQTVYLPSLRLLPGEAPAIAGGGWVLALGGRAPGVGEELAAIERAWPERTVRLEGSAATERAADSLVGGAAVLHVAAHARAGEGSLAYLELSPDGVTDGVWRVGEIAEGRRSIPLVVLSACETLVGPLYAGEGPFGLARAFLASGAEGVVATHWPIGARTADLMGHFYSELARGGHPGTALHAAKLRARADPELSHPFYWAGVVFIAGAGEAS